MLKKILPICATVAAAATVLSACGTSTAKTGSAKPAASRFSSSASSASASPAVSSASSASSSASSFPAPESDPRYVKAYGYYAKNEYDKAVQVCDQALAADPNCFWAYNIKGIATYFANGNSVATSCLKLIDKSTEINPDYSYGYFNKALIQKGLKRWDDSISNFKKVLSFNPKDTWSYYGIATVYADTRQTDLALKYLKLAIDLDPSGVKQQVQDDMERHFSRLKSNAQFQALIK